MQLLNGVLIFFSIVVLWGCSNHPQITQSKADAAKIGAGIFGGQNVASTDSFAKNVVGIISITKNENGTIRSRELCTGALIFNNVVLTAAHCLTPDAEVELFFGTDMYGAEVIKRPVVSRLIHADWLMDQKEGVNDIALLKFEGALPQDFQPVRLMKLNSIAENFDSYIIGYGRTSGQKSSQQLQKSDPRQGAGVLRKATVVAQGIAAEETSINMKQMYNQGACNGDSGGPAFMKLENDFILIGIASYAKINFTDAQRTYFGKVRGDIKKFLEKYPEFDFCKQDSFYMNVSYFVDWINFNIVNL